MRSSGIKIIISFVALTALAFSVGVSKSTRPSGSPRPAQIAPPTPAKEFRGLWVATVDNCDWPSKRLLSSQAQKAELLAIFDRAAALNFNAIILQVRPSCDAFYESRLEPWSEFLSGQMGQAPKPYYDPLAFAVAEAHKRGLELHAWFNPFRARLPGGTTPPARNHISKTHPELVRSYGSYLWMDPTDPATREYSLRVILDVVRRYDIDGVHFDDYFYPYKVKDADFPDQANWRRYQAKGGKLSRSDWRRENVNVFVETVYSSIKMTKPWVRFGISPFGIWQPKYPAQIQGLNAYEVLAADARKWLMNGWVDYLSPQLYWSTNAKEQSFPVLLKWWTEQNPRGRHVWPGMCKTLEVADQVSLTRKITSVPGEIFWHARSIMQNSNGVANTLSRKVFAAPALIPSSPWLNNVAPAQPLLSGFRSKARLKLSWKAVGSNKASRWYIQQKFGNHWVAEVVPGFVNSRQYKGGQPLPEAVAVWAVDRYGNISAPAIFQ